MATSRLLLVIAALTWSMLVPSCAQRDGDCPGRVRFEGLIFRPHTALSQRLPTGAVLGTADIVDCGDLDDAAKVDSVQVYAVAGVDSDIALATTHGIWKGVYVAEGVPRRSWPPTLSGG